MLYLEDDRRDLWPAVARALASLEPLDMVLFLYEGEGVEGFAPPFRAAEEDEFLEPVTGYSDGTRPLCSRRIPIDEAWLSWLEARTADFEDWGDALAAYRPGRYDLVAAAIPHEGMILVADEFGSAMAAAGYRLSSDPPDWW